jgi:hypothetical protein
MVYTTFGVVYTMRQPSRCQCCDIWGNLPDASVVTSWAAFQLLSPQLTLTLFQVWQDSNIYIYIYIYIYIMIYHKDIMVWYKLESHLGISCIISCCDIIGPTVLDTPEKSQNSQYLPTYQCPNCSLYPGNVDFSMLYMCISWCFHDIVWWANKLIMICSSKCRKWWFRLEYLKSDSNNLYHEVMRCIPSSILSTSLIPCASCLNQHCLACFEGHLQRLQSLPVLKQSQAQVWNLNMLAWTCKSEISVLS